MRWLRLLVVSVLAMSVGCSGPPGSRGLQQPELTIFAAASLKAALEAAKATYEPSTWNRHGLVITISTDSSAALRTQIEQGAAADLFLSADTRNPQALVDAGLTDGDAVAFAGNLLTIIVPSDNPGGVATPAGLATSGLKIIAAGDEVPITKYATELVANLAGLSGYPADFEAAYAANIVSREENVGSVVAKISTGEGDAAIVYVTDAAADDVLQIEVPAEANVPATYAGVVVKSSRQAPMAHEFLGWLAGAEGQAVLAEFGFRPPPS